jgi:hypothetical protein
MDKLKNYTEELATSHLDDSQIINRIEVTVSTKNIPFAGTDAKVFMNCGGLGTYFLNTPGEDDFEMGDIKTYIFETNCKVGELRKATIELGQDNTGKHPGWCVSGFRIQMKLQGPDILYLYKLWGGIGWLAKDKAPFYTTVIELQDGAK